jgi:hypothetical protein
VPESQQSIFEGEQGKVSPGHGNYQVEKNEHGDDIDRQDFRGE